MKKLLIPILLMALLCSLTACASKPEDTPPAVTGSAPTDGLMATDDMLPGAEATPGAALPGASTGSTVNTMTGVTTAARAREAVKQIEAELVRLSEVEDARVIVAGTTAVVAVDFVNQYRSGVDKRMENMIRERIRSVVSGVENVIITEDNAAMDTLAKLRDRLDGAADMTDLEAELKKLAERIRDLA